MGVFKVLLYVLFVTFPVWFTTWFGAKAEGILHDVAINFALVGFMMLMLPVLAGGPGQMDRTKLWAGHAGPVS